jgi:hypothetical protein
MAEQHKNYFKILILRDPIKRFYSALYEDCTSVYKYKFSTINLTVYEFLLLLQKINNNNVRHSDIENANKIYIDNKIRAHVHSQHEELSEDIQLINSYNCEFDKVIEIENFDSEMIQIKHDIFKGKISVPKIRKNIKKYIKSDIDISTIKVSNLCELSEFPDPLNFNNKRMTELIKDVYKQDYDLINKYNLKIE